VTTVQTDSCELQSYISNEPRCILIASILIIDEIVRTRTKELGITSIHILPQGKTGEGEKVSLSLEELKV
jgi:hypothetical protein